MPQAKGYQYAVAGSQVMLVSPPTASSSGCCPTPRARLPAGGIRRSDGPEIPQAEKGDGRGRRPSNVTAPRGIAKYQFAFVRLSE